MIEGWQFLGEILLLLVTAVAAGAVVERFGINAVVGYLLAGVVVGPGILGLVGDTEAEREHIAVIAELGVALLLFAIGLELTPSKLRSFGWRSAVMGAAQIIGTLVVVTGIAFALGRDLRSAVAIGCIVSLSSTAVVSRILIDRMELEAPHGRASLAILIAQDFAVVPMLLLVGLLARAPESASAAADAAGAAATVAEQATPSLWLYVTAAIVCVFGVFALPWLLGTKVFRRNADFPVILALGTCLVAAYGSHAVGLSPAFGSFLTGVILARTGFARQIRADVSAIRSIFLTLFFASVGFLADVQWILSGTNVLRVVALALFFIILKAVLAAICVRASGAPRRVAVAAGLSLAQLGEFSFVLGSAALAGSILSDDDFQMLVSASVVSLFATPALVGNARRLSLLVDTLLVRTRIWKPIAPDAEHAEHELNGHVIVAGYGPSGEETVSTVRLAGMVPYVIDMNPQLVASARAAGVMADVGNASRREILEHAHIESAAALVVTIPDPEGALATVGQARSIAPQLVIVARARFARLTSSLEAAGADHVISEEMVVGTLLGSTTVAGAQKRDADSPFDDLIEQTSDDA